MLKERDTALANLKKQAIDQHQAMTQQINVLQEQLAEKDTLLAGQGGESPGAGSSPDGGQQLLAEKARADKLAENLTKIMVLQQKAIEKHRKEAERLARELHALAAGIQMLGQSLGDQASEMSSAVAGDK
jgi:small-conductance mechanosensitive channel